MVRHVVFETSKWTDRKTYIKTERCSDIETMITKLFTTPAVDELIINSGYGDIF